MKAYAIKDPNGKIVKISINGRKLLIDNFGWYEWNRYYKNGYRCVPILITEVKK